MTTPERLLDGRYRLIDPIAHGGTAEVWRAHDEKLARPVAIKLIDARANATRVQEEAQALARLSHPHIANVYDYGARDDQAYVVMELVEGRPLADVLTDGPLPWPEAVTYCGQAAAALAAAHARGLVHRDVTPANLMLTTSGVKLIDFGLSAVEGQPEADADGGLRGTPAYVAPERLRDRTVAPAADIYSLGSVLYRTLAGRLPWQASTAPEFWFKQNSTAPDPLPAIEGLPAEIAAACLRCLAVDPAERPSAAELAAVLPAAPTPTPVVGVSTVVSPTQLLPGPVPVPSGPRWRAVQLVAAAAVLAVLGAAGWSAASSLVTVARPEPMVIAAPLAAQPVPACDVTYQLASDDGHRFVADITASHHTDALPAGWQLSIRLPGAQPVTIDPRDGWARDGDTVISAAQAALDRGSAAQFRLAGEHGTAIPIPSVFMVGEDRCDATLLGASRPAAPPGPAAKPAPAPRPGKEHEGKGGPGKD
jgi:serine/threonine-protein kinase